jgi:hypothetical protein
MLPCESEAERRALLRDKGVLELTHDICGERHSRTLHSQSLASKNRIRPNNVSRVIT